jgi:hypothetical protein
VRHENTRLLRKGTVQGHLSGINSDYHLKATKEDVIRIIGVQGAYEFYVDY